RLVALLRSSIFQSELLISEANFLKHFPSQSGYSYFLIEAPLEKRQEMASLLESNLNRHGLDATSTAEVLASYLAVENTYLSTFQTLGGLGLLLGTLGLGIVLVRNVLERRGELATLRAFGFPRSKLAWMVLAENGFLLMLGLVLGTASALVAVAPHLAGGGAPIPWLSLSLTLLAVLVVGLAAGAAAVVAALRVPLLPALKAE
ncbi:ABC transporter permease, partial [Acidobacteria bacterium AH-259-L09]|nr:ABC transporter permease [Acidobacteria bacterium AH-259-L09]